MQRHGAEMLSPLQVESGPEPYFHGHPFSAAEGQKFTMFDHGGTHGMQPLSTQHNPCVSWGSLGLMS